MTTTNRKIDQKLNNVDRNHINCYIYRYNIQDREESFNKLAEVINKREYYVYKVILYIINNCRVIEEDSGSITVEIDLLEHDHLLQDITGKFFTKKLKTRKFKKKIGRSDIAGNPFLTNKS